MKPLDSAKGGITMHEEQMSSTSRRYELIKSSTDFINIEQRDFKWLNQLTEKLVPKTESISPKAFTIKEHVGDYITVLRVEEEQIGRIRVWGYHPISYNKKWKKNNPKDEYPFFELEIRFVLGRATLETFIGNQNNKQNLWNDIKVRVLPIILYLQYFKEKLTVETKVSRVNGKKFQQNTYVLHPVQNEIPTDFYFLGKKWNIVKPELELNDSKLLKDGSIAIIHNDSDAIWLQKWAADIRLKSGMIPENRLSSYPLYDRRREKLVRLNAVRVNTGKNSFIQIMVNRLDDETFQLDYYDCETKDLQLILLINITNVPARFDIAYICGEGNVTKTDEMYANRIANMFLDILIYLRIQAWEDSIDESTGLYYTCDIYKMPDIPKELYESRTKRV